MHQRRASRKMFCKESNFDRLWRLPTNLSRWRFTIQLGIWELYGKHEPALKSIIASFRSEYVFRDKFVMYILILINIGCRYRDIFVVDNQLTPSWRRSLSYRNQFIDLLCNWLDWFLYDRDLCQERVKPFFPLLFLVRHRKITPQFEITGSVEMKQRSYSSQSETKVLIAWLQHFEDHRSFPALDVMELCDPWYEYCNCNAQQVSSRVPEKEILMIFIHPLKTGLFRIKMKTVFG